MSSIVLAAAVLLARPGAAGAQEPGPPIALPEIVVESHRSVTVMGSSESLRAVIGALCAEAGIELRSYRAPDRPITAGYTNLPIRQVLERLLRQESFAMGFADQPGSSKPRLAWLRVIGTEGEQASGGSAGTFSLPMEGVAGDDISARRRAAREYALALRVQEHIKDKFLSARQSVIVDWLEDKPHAKEFLIQVRANTRDAEVRAKIAEIMKGLR